MLSKSQISYIQSLQLKKYRKKYGFFVVEGLKSIIEFINSDYVIDSIYYAENSSEIISKIPQNIKLFEINNQELKKISSLQNPQGFIAVLKIPSYDENFNLYFKKPAIHLVLDGVQDPGNLGTIIRNANWFGYKHIFCSNDTVDVYNPKVIQSTMGALSSVKIIYTDLLRLISLKDIPVIGASLSGENIYNFTWPNEAFLIFGSEGNGVSKEIENFITTPVNIPGLGNTESLNVAISNAIFCSEMQRNLYK